MNENKYDKSKLMLFDKNSIDIINEMVKENADKEILDLATKTNDKGNPIFNSAQILEIKYGMFDKLPVDKIKIYAIDNNGYSLYDNEQMSIIRQQLKFAMPMEYIDIFIQLKDGKPLFNSDEMKCIVNFIDKNTHQKILQFKDCIADGLTIKQFKPFLENI